MSKEDGGEFLKAFGLASVVFGCCFLLIWAFSSRSDWYQQTATNRSHGYASQAKAEIADRCSVLPLAEQEECKGQAKQSARANQRDEQDLAAQKITAWWTKIMGGAAIFGAVLSAIGVMLVFTTFRETRRAAFTAGEQLKLAQTEQRHSLRPYLFVDRIQIEPEKLSDGYWNLPIVIFLKNYGKLPARDISIRSHVYISNDLTKLRQDVYSTPPVAIPFCAPDNERQAFDGILLNPGEYDGLAMGLMEIVIRVRIAYRRTARRQFRERADYVFDSNSLRKGTIYVLTDGARERREGWRADLVDMMRFMEGEFDDVGPKDLATINPTKPKRKQSPSRGAAKGKPATKGEK